MLGISMSRAAGAWSLHDAERVLAEGRAATTVDIDNDSLLLQRGDGLYTSGLRFTRSHRLKLGDEWHTTGWRIGQQLYTPQDVRLAPAQVDPRDRPYAGWLYAGVFHRIDQPDGSEVAFGLDLGCLGPCAGGEATQEFVHRLLHQPQPQGWDSQIGRAFGVVLHAGGRSPAWRMHPSAEWRPGLAFRLGNIFTDATADLTLRFGQLQGDFHASRWSGFLRASARAVAHDATMQGAWGDREEGRTVEPRRTTTEAEAGVQWQRRAWSWRISLVRRANELRALPSSEGRQDFLRISFTVAH